MSLNYILNAQRLLKFSYSIVSIHDLGWTKILKNNLINSKAEISQLKEILF